MKIDLPRDPAGLQNKASSPRLPADDDNEFAAFAAQLAARSERLRAGSPSMSPPPSQGRAGIDAQLTARAARLRSTSPSTPDINPAEPTRDFAGRLWRSSPLLALVAGVAILAAWWGLPFQSSKPLPSSHIEPAKAAVTDAADPQEKAAQRIAAPPVISLPAPQEVARPDFPPASTASQTPLATPANVAPLTWDEVRELQSELGALGFVPGPVDGVVGPMTQSALRKYAESRDIPNEEATRDLLIRLKAEPRPKK